MSMDIGIDLGTANVLIYIKGKGIVMREPSVVAIDNDTNRILAIGEDARRMIGRTPGNIVAIRPLRDGVIANYEITEQMIRYFIGKVSGRRFMFRPRVMICVPSRITTVEKRAVQEAAMQAGASHAELIEEPMAAAMGAGLDVAEPNGCMVVDIGGGTTDVAVISLGGVVVSDSLRMAGDKFDDCIITYINNIYYKEETNRPSESIWKRIIDNLLKLFGIKVNNNSVLQQIQNAFDEGFMFIVYSVEVENNENATSKQTSERPPSLVANKQASIDDIDVTTLSDEEFMNNGDELFLRIDFAISDETTNEISDETTNEAIETKDDTSILATRARGRYAVLPTNSINSSDNRNKLLSLNIDTNFIVSFKDSFTDSSNLKIC